MFDVVQTPSTDLVTAGETLLIELCRQEHGRNPRRQQIRLELWQPNSARKSVLRQFVGLWLDDEPLYVAKIPLSPEDRKVERELTILQQCAALNLHVPQPLRPIGRGFVMRYLKSHDLPEILRAATTEQEWQRLVEQVVDTMIEFHRAGLAPATARPEAVARDYVGAWQASAASEQAALSRAQVGMAHGDLGPWNIRYDQQSGGVNFLDWEDFREQGLPALDLLNFVFTLPIIIYPDYAAIGFERLYELVFAEQQLPGRLAVASLNRYGQALNCDPRDLCALVPLYCEAMLERFRCEGRPTDKLFYGPFQRRFALEDVAWLADLGR